MTFPKLHADKQNDCLIQWDDFMCELADAMNDEAALIESLNEQAEQDRAYIVRREEIFG